LGLSATPAFTATGENEGDYFGHVVATAGDVNGDGYADIIVGAPSYPNDDRRGKVYVYYGSPLGLGTTPVFTATGEANNDGFGYSVATAGDVNGDGYADVLIGADRYPSAGLQGKLYIYHGSGNGLSANPSLMLLGENNGDRFGRSVATAGDLNGDSYADIIIGAPGYPNGNYQGKVYVYHGSAAGLDVTAAFTPAGESAEDWFGWSVATAGDANGDGYADILIGASLYGTSDSGKMYVYDGSASGLEAVPGFTTTGENSNDWFGQSVGTAGDVNGDGYADILVGAVQYPTGASRGKAYVYHGAGDGLQLSPTFTLTGEDNRDYFGLPVATAGDVDGDGYTDIIVGAYNYANGRGRVYVYPGGWEGLSISPAFTATGENEGDQFGAWVATAGDVNGDGYADVIVGAPAYPGGRRGKVYVYHGSETGLSATFGFTLTGENSGDGFGFPVASAGDVNGDGYADIVIGAPGYSSGNYRGKVYVYYGSGGGLVGTPAFTAVGESDGDSFGISAAMAGDVNGDGYADLIVGANRFHAGTGKVYVYHGGSAGLDVPPAFTITGENEVDYFGASVATAGDVNGDGYADVIVGAYGHPDGLYVGKTYVYYGGDGGLSMTPAFTSTGEGTNNEFGRSVATAGDLNGDSYADVIVGARAYNILRGRVYVYYGSATGVSMTSAFTASGENIFNSFGYSVATAGDVNGDGYADVVVGARDYPNGNAQGRAYVYLGGEGRPVLAHQERVDGSGTLVQPWGLSHNRDTFQVQMLATDPMGRGRVKLQVQACPPGVPFGGVNCLERTSAIWADVGTTTRGITLTTSITGLADNTLYRWRARVLYAPYHVDLVAPPPNPAHGPWRRLFGQGLEADLRAGTPAASISWIHLPIILKNARP